MIPRLELNENGVLPKNISDVFRGNLKGKSIEQLTDIAVNLFDSNYIYVEEITKLSKQVKDINKQLIDINKQITR